MLVANNNDTWVDLHDVKDVLEECKKAKSIDPILPLFKLQQGTSDVCFNPIGIIEAGYVYLLFKDDRLVYIGTSQKSNRSSQHRTKRRFNKVYVMLCKNNSRWAIEAMLIKYSGVDNKAKCPSTPLGKLMWIEAVIWNNTNAIWDMWACVLCPNCAYTMVVNCYFGLNLHIDTPRKAIEGKRPICQNCRSRLKIVTPKSI